MAQLSLIVACTLLASAAPAQQVAHETFTIQSKALGEARRIHLYKPPKTNGPPTVLYLLDGGNDEDSPHPGMMAAIDRAVRAGKARPIVVVGIENTERRRDMTEPTQVESDKKIAPHVGGATAFRTFIETELMPAVKQKVPGQGDNAIVGESLAGLFVLETLVATPHLFDTWVAISPSLWWNAASLQKGMERWLKAHESLPGRLYLARAGDDVVEPIDAFAAALKKTSPRGLVFTYEPRGELHHADIYETLAPSLIERLWPAR